MKLMVEIEGRDEILETQEELLKLEREKIVGLEKSLSKERKSFKVQEDLLNAKAGKLLEIEVSLSKEKEEVAILKKELSLASETIASLKGVNETLQENFSCLHADYKDLESKHDILKNNTLDSNDATKSFVSTTSKTCARCCNINVESCATNLAEMHVMKNEIAKLTRMVNENTTTSKIGEFEKHTKGFGSSYMMKYEFVKEKGIGKNAQGEKEPIPFTKNNNYAGIGKMEAKVEGMAPTCAKVNGKRPMHNNNKASHYQVKKNKTDIPSTSGTKQHASQSSFYADYVLTWNHKGKYVGYRTKDTLIKRNVWVPNVLVTNTLGPKSVWVPKT